MRVRVDVDDLNILTMFKRFKLIWELGGTLEHVKLSASGKGYHLYVEFTEPKHNELEYRALLWDCAGRISYSIRRMAMSGKTEHSDIMFSYKYGTGSETDVTKEFKKAYDLLRTKSVKEVFNVRNWRKELDLKHTQPFKTCFIVADDKYSDLKQVLIDISAQDLTFSYRLVPNIMPYKKSMFVCVIYSSSKDTAYQRGAWFVKRAGVGSYWVKYPKKK